MTAQWPLEETLANGNEWHTNNDDNAPPHKLKNRF